MIVTIDFVMMIIFAVAVRVLVIGVVAMPMRVSVAVVKMSMGVVDMPRAIVMRICEGTTQAVRSREARDQTEHGQGPLHRIPRYQERNRPAIWGRGSEPLGPSGSGMDRVISTGTIALASSPLQARA